ncbi:MAG: ABC transporter substrate-binding protein [candidate division NC10 bacterium]|nr:ABC transporter substrate-binding protein [candidate division NC10 bacterium]MBI2115784.1 ABC transporter substrate-binding protein [candidate division NC10 bacterium]MBI2164065.1 ABC transporter substrate-binding protein [candidate division NC10 bacterium]MBI2458882.1 ABC transporter substrate-binding protein [candidate division NC10 bacterium]
MALVFATALILVLVGSMARAASEPKYGGVLNATLSEPPPSFSIHEEATVAAVWPMMPCYNNLVLFDPLKKQESLNTIIGELAEKWAWQDGGKALVFHLRKGVKWHDGQPFTSKDVKHTFDVVREAPGAPAKLRVNPRKLWYENVSSIDTPDPDTVIFRLKRPQPSLLLMLASGYSPVYPAHVPPAELRTKCVGTGPFKLKEYRAGEYVDLIKNPDYMIKGRPYLDGIRYVIIRERGTRYSAIQAGRMDIAYPLEVAKTIAESVKQAVPSMVLVETSTNVNDHILVNFKRPLFQDSRVRRAINLAIDRKGYIQAGRQGAAISGGITLPKPYGVWGLPEKEQAKMPGFGDPVKNKAEAKKVLAEAGYGPGKPLKVTVSTRAISYYVDIASYIIDQLRQVGIEATLEQVETGVWHPKLTRREYDMAVNLTGIGPDDPDANLFENFKCGSPRNYSEYCNPEVDRLIEEQSQTLDPAKRLQLVHDLDTRLQLEGARLLLGWSKEYYLMWPSVKNLVPHQSVYNYGRMQEVWLDK